MDYLGCFFFPLQTNKAELTVSVVPILPCIQALRIFILAFQNFPSVHKVCVKKNSTFHQLQNLGCFFLKEHGKEEKL